MGSVRRLLHLHCCAGVRHRVVRHTNILQPLLLVHHSLLGGHTQSLCFHRIYLLDKQGSSEASSTSSVPRQPAVVRVLHPNPEDPMPRAKRGGRTPQVVLLRSREAEVHVAPPRRPLGLLPGRHHSLFSGHEFNLSRPQPHQHGRRGLFDRSRDLSLHRSAHPARAQLALLCRPYALCWHALRPPPDYDSPTDPYPPLLSNQDQSNPGRDVHDRHLLCANVNGARHRVPSRPPRGP
mmetsp:Transcript_20752/g.34182  ORF Transcript_20752/g.34182 Transcript_20752/m.34182 type:complete len:236 (+) Transcript_20752:105-812(+)